MTLLVLAILILAAAWVFNLGILAYAFYVLLAVFLVSHFFASGWIGALKARREVDQLEAEVNESIKVEVAVRNSGRLPISWVLIEDMLSKTDVGKKGQRLQIKGQHMEVADFKAGGAMKLKYEIKGLRRGYYQVGPLVAETGDLFGLNRRYQVLSKPSFLLVRPKLIQLDRYDLASRRPIGEIVMTHRFFEDPTRISGIRQYQNGDPLSRIHWRATARTGELQCKVFEASTVAGATVVLDFHRDAFDAKDEPMRSELAVTCAASIANAVQEMGQQVGFVSNGRDAADRIREDGWRGDRRTRSEALGSASMDASNERLRPVVVQTARANDQMVRTLRSLARLELTDGLTFFELVSEAQQQLPRDATVIAILTKVDLEVGVALGELRRQGYAVTAIINCYDLEKFSHLSGLLLAEGIEARHLRDEDSIRGICEKQVMLRG